MYNNIEPMNNMDQKILASMPPGVKKVYRPLVKELKALFKGEKFEVEIPYYGLIAAGDYSWEFDDEAAIDFLRIKIDPNADPLAKRILKVADEWRIFEMDKDKFYDTVIKTKEYKAFEKRIKVFCKAIEKIDTEGFNFELEIFQFARR